MINAKRIWKPVVQKLVTGSARQFKMVRSAPQWPGQLTAPGLYLHVPFCKNMCPYCPYNRVEYDADLFEAYSRAVKQEIDLYAPYLQGMSFGTLYIGGGTPTVNWPGLVSIVRHIRATLGAIADICVELHPANMASDCLSALKEIGVSMLSIGVESTSDVVLERIQRCHDGRTAIDAVIRAMKMEFKSINVDLMFALPGQSLNGWQKDVTTMVGLGVDQISTYPMFSFPYSDMGRKKGIRHVTRPPHKVVKAMLEFCDAYCEASGFRRCAVWSWLRPAKKKFSSITRHHYIGFGPSAASMTGSDFYVNTFDVKAYASMLPADRPVAVSMAVNRRLEMAYWLYWRIYELKIDDHEFRSIFGAETSLDSAFAALLNPLIPLGLLKRINGAYRVTKPGAYWIHRLQNEYSLNYINNLWGACRQEPWPEEIRL
ncbi:MAG: radical SAM protein [Desulfobacterales bacterium]|nr:radical SAM protein [Desulfobacterales bacterium]